MKTFTTFITSEELISIINNENLVIVDCRFDLANPDWGLHNYITGHLPKAIYAHLNNDLSDQIGPTTGRHPLPPQEKFFLTCSLWGINSSSQVIVYDTSFGSFAARLWWMLKYYGHENVAILEGGFSQWVLNNYPIETGKVTPTPSTFFEKRNEDLLVTTNDMEKIIKQEDWAIIDARAPERFSGELEPLDAIAGRIPNSVNFFHQKQLDEVGRLLPKNQLESEYNSLINNKSKEKIVLYCGSGVTSCFSIAVMNHLGIQNTKLYLGSWSEWIRNKNHPIINDFGKDNDIG